MTARARDLGWRVEETCFNAFPSLLNGASQLIADVFGRDIGDHTRVAIGVAALPFNAPVEIEAEVELR